jgi:3-phenylpropionate/cinnamic acid dioxygenase small subunit
MTAGDQIRNLLGLYCERIDAGDFAAVGELFAHGALATADGHELARGADRVAAFYARGTRLHDELPRTKHLVTNTVLDVDEEAGSATARSSYVVLQQVGTAPLQPIIAGRYHDDFERTDGAWRFAERRFFVDLQGDLSQHLAYAIG